jgi:hypothetical protein
VSLWASRTFLTHRASQRAALSRVVVCHLDLEGSFESGALDTQFRLYVLGRSLSAIMDVGGWLRSLGLEQYEAAFRDNVITENLLPSLTAEDLRDLGVSVVGHRRALLNAIADLRSAKDADQAPSPAFETIGPTSKDTAERRQVTVMFSDLVGSTAMSTRMDAEDLRDVISAYQKCVAETVRRFGGYVAKYMGDGVLIYFGHPQAHEDDAERAVRAGLELVAAVGALKSTVSLRCSPSSRANLPTDRRPTPVRAPCGIRGEVKGELLQKAIFPVVHHIRLIRPR